LSGVLTSIAVVAGVGVVLAVLLEVAGSLFADYGDVSIDINSGARKLEVPGGNKLLATLREKKIFIPSACGGRGTCGECRVRVLEGGGPLLPTEAPHLTAEQRQDRMRIACQLKVRGDLQIEIPEELFLIKSWTTRLAKKTRLNYDTVELRLELPAGETISFKPGQYVQLKTVRYRKVKEEVYRAYSISSSAQDDRAVEIVVRLVPGGIATTWVHDVLQEDAEVEISGPYGEFYLRDSPREIFFIAGGSGLAPIKSILHQIEEEKIDRKVNFYFGALDLRDLFHVETMREFEKRIPGFTYIPALSDPSEETKRSWKGDLGLVTEVVARRAGAGIKDGEAYLCGSPGMIKACVASLTGMGMPQEHIYYDEFV
jgi:Na+-transporting NADH:ubiquinone oxidoreductase subunit F